jgi:class 3 adenylate cyclase/PAS domain-containing protein
LARRHPSRRPAGTEGEWRWARQHAVALRNETGRVHRIVGASSDITERKRVEAELAETSTAKDAVLRRLNAVLDHISYGVLFAEADLRAQVGNRAYRDMWGIPEELLAEKPTFAELIEYNRNTGIYGVADDQWDEYVESRVKAIKKGNTAPTEFRLGNGKILQYQCIALPDGSRMVTYFDITDLKQREEELAEKTAMLESLSVKLSKYLSPQIYNSIFSGQQAVEITSERKKLTIFFSDIAGFTVAADSLESEELTGLLNQYLTAMSKIALKYGATIDKYVGDAIMVFFGDPESKGVKKDAIACVEMAIAMQRRMAELQVEWRDQGIEHPFQLRIGINTGYCTVGNFGSEDRMDYTIIGNEVNLAARLQSHAELGGVLMANETYSLVKDIVLTEEGDTITAKGFAKPVRTYSVAGLYDELVEQGRVIRKEQEGVRVLVDLKKGDKAHAIQAIKDVLSQLED